ncbi:MAG: hypothetical protein AAF525_18200 [Pseudomonadota bacterium]
MKQQIDIENLVIWAFQREAASLRDDGLDITARSPRDSTVRCEEVGKLGGFVTGTAPGARVMAEDSHPDAVAVTDAMSKLDPDVARLVAQHAKAGTRPDWRPHAHFRLEPRSWDWDDGSGEEWGVSEVVPLHERDTWEATYRSRKGRVAKAPTSRWVPIIAKDTPDAVRGNRNRYVTWWEGLHTLGLALHGSLGEWDLSDIMPDREPWVQRSKAA